MTISRFRQLWTHRYHKYTHIFKAHGLGLLAAIRFYLVKAGLKKGQPLIAIIRTEHFGDIVAGEPIARYVRSLYPGAYIVWFVKPTFAELVSHHPDIDEVLKEFCVTQRRTLLRAGVFDRVYELQFSNNNVCRTCDVTTDNPVAVSRGIDVGNYFQFGNLLEVFAKTSGLIPVDGLFPFDDQPKLYLLDQHRAKVDSLQLKRPFIAVHCQSNFAPKDWPAERWEQLIGWLIDQQGYTVVEIGLKSNLDIHHSAYRNLCGQLSLLETAEVIRRADYFIGLDSGPSHFANAAGTYGIVLMGALGGFSSYNPYSGGFGRQENARLVRQEGLPCSALSYEWVQDEVAKVLNK